MGDFSPEPERDIQPILTQAELTFKKLLEKQLATTGRLEQVEFEEATENMQCIGHGSCGVTSRAQFIQNEILQKHVDEKTQLRVALQSKGFPKTEAEKCCHKMSFPSNPTMPASEKGTLKKRRYGAHPLFNIQAETEINDASPLQRTSASRARQNDEDGSQNISRHAKELESSLLSGKDRLQKIAHLSFGGNFCRRPLESIPELSTICVGTTPDDRARCSSGQVLTRSTDNVFSNPAPEVLDLHSYLEQKQKLETIASNSSSALEEAAARNTAASCSTSRTESGNLLNEIPEAEIICNRLSEEEIRQLPGGKFANYVPGEPSHILYIKNLCPKATEADLATLFLRYQVPGKQLVFRLMQWGRMKGQAFITFPDIETAQCAFQFINGYKLKGRPMVIQFGKASS